jgi:hypothetical protein
MLIYDPDWIIKHIHDIRAFSKDLLKASVHAIETKDFSRLEECLLSWEATAEFNAIPRMLENVVAGLKSIRQGTDEKLPTWEEFLGDMGQKHG